MNNTHRVPLGDGGACSLQPGNRSSEGRQGKTADGEKDR